jgi:hypothetical protein
MAVKTETAFVETEGKGARLWIDGFPSWKR